MWREMQKAESSLTSLRRKPLGKEERRAAWARPEAWRPECAAIILRHAPCARPMREAASAMQEHQKEREEQRGDLYKKCRA
mmetsp:Transcript_4882/g.12254  ORF Transcript_4882/g.12254 Transcript_4882/m.12254 type:complete len:81 (-) Transcript_4882:18-260(-)